MSEWIPIKNVITTTVLMTQHGMLLNGVFYSSGYAIKKKWFTNTPSKITIEYSPIDLSKIFIRFAEGDDTITAYALNPLTLNRVSKPSTQIKKTVEKKKKTGGIRTRVRELNKVEKIQVLPYEVKDVSYLYRLQPEGIGTGQCEGLISYITRLSQAHHLLPFTLIKFVLVPALGKNYMVNDMKRGGARFFQRSKTLNGVGSFSQQIILALQELTSWKSLNQLTMLPWKKGIVDKYLLKESKAWCSSCFNNWRTAKQTVYEPLVWSLKDMSICPIHNQSLSSICPNPACKKQIPVLIRNSSIGYCPNCLMWLGEHTTSFNRNDDWEKRLWVSTTLFNLVSRPHEIEREIDINTIQKSFVRLLSVTNGNIPKLALSLQLHRSNVWQYCNGLFVPPLHTMLMICFHFKISLIDFLSGQDYTPLVKQPTTTIPYKTKLRHQKLDYLQLDEKIRHLKAITPPLSLTEIARKVHHSTKTLNKNFPLLTTLIKAEYRNYRSFTRKQTEIRTCSDIRAAVISLVDQGVFPSKNSVEKYLKRPGILQRPEYKESWRDMKKRLGESI